MSVEWAGDPTIGIAVYVSTAGPADPPGSGTLFNLCDHAGINYVRGEPGIQIDRGRSDEFSHFQSGTLSFSLKNNNREFDPALTEIALDLPAGTSNATTPDVAAFTPGGDLEFRMRLSMDNWQPGGFGRILASQWASPSSEGWLLGVNPSGFLQLSFTTDGATDLTRTSTVPVTFAPGSVHWLRWLLDVNNGAAGHDVSFYTSEDGNTWNQLGATVTTAGTVTVFNSTATVRLSDTALPMSGQLYRFQFLNNGIVVADPDFSAQTPTTVGFTDRVGRVWTVNGTGSIGYDNHASVFAPILKPRRLVYVLVARGEFASFRLLFVGFIEGWPQTWTSTTGTVQIVAHDLLSVLAQATTTHGTGVLILDNPQQGRLDFGRLAGDLPQQSTGQRIADLVGLAGVSEQHQMLDTGVTDVVAIEPSGDVLSLCQEAETAEAGFLFVDRDGRLVFLDRHARFRETRLATVQATFTDSEYTGMSLEYGLAQMWNVARFIRPARDDADVPVEQIAMDEVSMVEFGRRSFPQEGATQIPVTSDAEALGRAEFWVDRYSVPQQRPSPVTVKMRRNVDSFYPRITDRDLLDRIVLERTPQGIGATARFMGLIEQLQHRITKTEWDCTFAISPIDVDEGQTFLILDDANLGQLDQESLAY